jgi:riboflavin-specific deaminase-like protein
MAPASVTFRFHRGTAAIESLAAADLARRIAAERRPPPADRPWMLVNMIASLDGAVAVDGLSGGLGGPADKVMFRALRGLADAIVVGAGTARSENYGPAVVSDEIRLQRQGRGQTDVPQMVIVTRSARLDPTARLFAPGSPQPLVYTAATADPDRVDALRAVAEVVAAGDDGVDPIRMTADLAERGHRTVLTEGGPSLNADLLAAGVVDEFCLSVAPLIVGGGVGRVVKGDLDRVRTMHLDRMIEADGMLFLRYVSASG